MIGGGVNMPALEVRGLVVPIHGWQLGVLARRVIERESRAIAPVCPVAGDVSIVIFEGGVVVLGETAGQGERYG